MELWTLLIVVLNTGIIIGLGIAHLLNIRARKLLNRDI